MTRHRGHTFDESALERACMDLFVNKLDWDCQEAFRETFGAKGTLGRETEHEVVLTRYLLAALQKLNPDIPKDPIESAIEELCRDRSTMSAVNANREIYLLLKDGVTVTFKNDDGERRTESVRVIDWQDPKANDFLLVSQFWVTGDMYRRRADLVGFVNGIPLVFAELKASHKRLEDAFNDNLRDYRTAVPQLFWYNGFVLLSNGSESLIGSTTAAWEHFAHWKRINDEGETGVISLETIVRGTCDKTRLLDIVENFTAFQEARGGPIKLVAKNHQALGVNRAIEAVQSIEENKGRLGVFWHTQGSGKSASMLFFSQKILRKLPGNWTFLMVTDRVDLDDQLYKTFANSGAITEKHARAETAEGLKLLLQEDHRYVFTLVQKFRTEKGKRYPKLSDRKDIIVITDEAHRSQYDTFAQNMRNALPNAAFIGFTGTPLMDGSEEKTKQVYGDYVSVYNFRESKEDGATVGLFYENRIPELQLTNDDLNDDIYNVIEEASLDDDEQQKLERELARQYHLITRDDRLETVAEDIVSHFMGRGFRGKAMVVSIDKATAVRMYDKVQKHWKKTVTGLRAEIEKTPSTERRLLEERLAFMVSTDMAVVVSQSQNEIEDMKKKGLDIKTHRKRFVQEEMDEKFKDPDDPLRIVFLCAMWMTGFDVPSCSTIYLDKPMRNHTLMQTIARANRVYRDKEAGIIVDYVGVFRSLQKALAIYAAPGAGGGDCPVADKSELVGILNALLAQMRKLIAAHGVDKDRILEAEALERFHLLDQAVEKLIVNDDEKRKFLVEVGHVTKVFKAIKPDPMATESTAECVLYAVLAEKIRALAAPVDISEVMARVEKVLDESIASEGYVIQAATAAADPTAHLVDLTQIDFEKLKRTFDKAPQRSVVERLRSLIGKQVERMVTLNRSRTDYLERFQRLIDEYNAGSLNLKKLFEELVEFAAELNEEEKRAATESLTEEELALFDLLTKPDPKLTKKQEAAVKKIAQALLVKLKKERLVLDWRKKQQTRESVRLCIEEELDKLPEVYARPIYTRKCDLTYRHVYDSYFGEGQSVYGRAA